MKASRSAPVRREPGTTSSEAPGDGDGRFRALVDGAIQGVIVHRGGEILLANPEARVPEPAQRQLLELPDPLPGDTELPADLFQSVGNPVGEPEPEYHGELVEFDRLWFEPKPLQVGGPKILLGVMGPLGIRHAAQWADGWMPVDITTASASSVSPLDRWSRRRPERCSMRSKRRAANTLFIYPPSTRWWKAIAS